MQMGKRCRFSALELLEDIVGSCGPDEGFWLVFVLFDVVEDGLLKLIHAGEDSTAELVPGEFVEEAFDHVEPVAGGWREVEVESLMASGPLQHVGCLCVA